jgi:GntR family transcriptional regulator / MocR family aminotransferase
MNIQVDIRGREGLSGQIYKQLQAGILDGSLPVGERLPSTRSLAAQLGVSRKTTLDVFERLITDGYLRTHPGSGTFVAERPSSILRNASASGHRRPDLRSVPSVTVAASSPRTNQSCGYFATGLTDKENFPFEHWRLCINHALRQQARERTAYRDPAGEQNLRQAICRHLAFNRSVLGNWTDVVVTQGAQQGIDLIARAVIRPGDVVVVEDPGYPQARASFAALGARIVSVPVDAQGLMVDRLPGRARMVYVTPAHQFPLGMSMSMERRKALLDWARTEKAFILEDDYDGEFRFRNTSHTPLKSQDTDGLVGFVGSFSTTMFPELRMGYVVPPAELVKSISLAKQTGDLHSCTLIQNALAKFMLDGYFGKHLRRMHKLYARKRDMLLTCLEGDLGTWFEPVTSDTGIHLTAFLRRNTSTCRVFDPRTSALTGLSSISDFYACEPALAGIRFGYGGIETHELANALRLLSERLDERYVA